jgi:VIT1/CCC1 family predicted Fe2+/Mn2+ transporter
MSTGISADPIRHAITEIAIALALSAVSILFGVAVPIAAYLVMKGF